MQILFFYSYLIFKYVLQIHPHFLSLLSWYMFFNVIDTKISIRFIIYKHVVVNSKCIAIVYFLHIHPTLSYQDFLTIQYPRNQSKVVDLRILTPARFRLHIYFKIVQYQTGPSSRFLVLVLIGLLVFFRCLAYKYCLVLSNPSSKRLKRLSFYYPKFTYITEISVYRAVNQRLEMKQGLGIIHPLCLMQIQLTTLLPQMIQLSNRLYLNIHSIKVLHAGLQGLVSWRSAPQCWTSLAWSPWKIYLLAQMKASSKLTF